MSASDTRLSLWIGLRYLRGHRRARISNAFVISMLGVSMGVAVLITVMSVINGFHQALHTRILGFIPHLLVMGDYPALQELAPSLTKVPEIREAARFLALQGLIQQQDGRTQPIQVHGVDALKEAGTSIVPEHMTAGSLGDLARHSRGIVLGASLVELLDLRLADEVMVLAADHSREASSPRIQILRFVLVGIFEVGAEPDYTTGLVDIDRILEKLPRSATRTGWRIQLHDAMKVQETAAAIAEHVDAGTTILPWTESHGALFRTLRMEKALMFVLLLFIVTIASLNLVSAQAIMVDHKRGDIGILRTMGWNARAIGKVFLVQGLVIGVTGSLFGTMAGIVLSLYVSDLAELVQQWIGFNLVAGTYFDRLPTAIELVDVLLIVVAAVILTLASSLHPARYAANLNPVSALSHG